MAMRLTAVPQDNTTGENTDPLAYETVFDGQTFNWGPGEVRAFGDDGQGIGHINNDSQGPAGAVVQDNSLSAKYYPATESRS